MRGIAIVTGGTRGIGCGISKALHNAGYKVAANYNKDESAARRFQEETGIETFSWDVADYQSCERGIATVCDRLGAPVDILINNAGITRDSMFHKMTYDAWQSVMNINLNSVFNMCRLVIPGMRDRRFGRIINISSINGLKGQIGQVNYSASKAGVIGFTKALAQESAAKNITVNAIAPGYISTEMTDVLSDEIKAHITSGIPIGRFGVVDEVAAAVLFLVDEKASFITGTVLNVNGGQYM